MASESGVDSRIIFAVILQESTCVLSYITAIGNHPNPGLMQSHNSVSFTDEDSILQMIRDGTLGTHNRENGGDGLKQLIDKYDLYGGLRAYNSGELVLHMDDLSVAINPMTCNVSGYPPYVSDIAQRLMGTRIAT